MSKKLTIAIDGPAAAGKSTIAKIIAKKYGYTYIDTGAMYRSVAYYTKQRNIDWLDEKSVCSVLADMSLKMTPQSEVFLNGENVNGVIRTEEVGNMASATSVYPVVRTKLVELQRELASTCSVIMDGRDIGTCVLPNAEVKIYLTASSATRAKRRYDELTAKGISCDLNEIEQDIIDRDYRDMNRETSPLKQAEDAVLVDTSEMNIAQVVEEINKIYKNKTNC